MNCQYLKAFGFSNEKKCNSIYGLNSLYLKDQQKTYSGEIEICQTCSQIFVGNLMDKELLLTSLIGKTIKQLNTLGNATVGEISEQRKNLSKEIKNQNAKRRIIRNKECRLETCGHQLKCKCKDCFGRQGDNALISSITVFSSKGYRRNTLNFHRECFYIAVRRIGVNISLLGKQLTLEKALITNK